ncbi:MAG TPA: tRNA 2-thiouridine(34) synthase MnmA [Mycobacteriales bacterium]|nr:tRNA 2-thiouridine(34) synthase MnmA [Mycobacteriales bacterium]
MKLLAALSGGVDSAVAAALAVEEGHDVTAVHLALAEQPATLRAGSRGCCSREDARDAARVADVLGIPFYVWDLAARFRADVVDDFVAEYAAGRTPNPCLRCNEKIKFAAVLDRALALGFDAVVTGHHARLEDGVLRRSVDADKDQSYVLAVLTPEQLAGARFPLGGMTKDQVRAEAARRALAVADKPDSHDVCFIADGDTRAFLRDHLGDQPGPVVDALTGAVVGRHDGAYAYTVGQRRGLDLRVPSADGRPRYVLSVEPVAHTVVVGPAEALDVTELRADRPVWTSGPRALPLDCAVQLRAHGAVHDARVASDGDGWQLRLSTPARGVAPGQAAVLYDSAASDAAVLGSATLTAALPAVQ